MRLPTFRLCHRMGSGLALPRRTHALRTVMLAHGISTTYLFWFKCRSLFHLSILTRFITSSPLLPIPPFLAPFRIEASRVDLPLRFSLHRCSPVGLRCPSSFPPCRAVPDNTGQSRKHMAAHMVESQNFLFYSNIDDFVSHLTRLLCR